MSLWDSEEEKQHFLSVVRVFKSYKDTALKEVYRKIDNFMALPQHHQKMMRKYGKGLQTLCECINENHEILQLVIQDVETMFKNKASLSYELHHFLNDHDFPLASQSDMERLNATVKQVMRDWSADGAKERNQCYMPIIDQIIDQFPAERAYCTRVLVPGAGCGRLAFEIACRGFICEGNEFSLYMLFVSQFVLNKCKTVNEHKIYPWTTNFVNNKSSEDQIASVSFPDVIPGSYNVEGFSMAAGDFLDVYTEPDRWDCIATCFFIDCAHNIATFIETIFNILRPGGVWINFGPLLYHFADIPYEYSVEPSYDVVRNIIEGVGFVFEVEEKDIKATYTQNPRSMLKFEYSCVFFRCRKPS